MITNRGEGLKTKRKRIRLRVAAGMTYTIRSYVDPTMPSGRRNFAYHGAFIGFEKCMIQKDQETDKMFLKRCRQYFGGTTAYRDENGSTHLIDETTREDRFEALYVASLEPWGTTSSMTAGEMRIIFTKLAAAFGLSHIEMKKVLEAMDLRDFQYSFEIAISLLIEWGVLNGTIRKFDPANVERGSGRMPKYRVHTKRQTSDD